METDSSTENNVGSPWGVSDTLIFGFLILIITYFAAYIPFFGLFVLSDTLGLDLPPMDEITENNGFILALWTIATLPIFLLLLCGVIHIRKDINFREYIGCYPLTLGKLFKWLGVLLLFLISTILFSKYIGRPFSTDFMDEAYNTAGSLPLLFIALVIATPLTEEFLFRGFLLTGFKHSRLGWLGGIIICSLFWSVRFTQYDWYNITWIFLLGLILGYAKKDSQSIYLPLILHALVNTLAFVSSAIYLEAQPEKQAFTFPAYYEQCQGTDYSQVDHYLQLLDNGNHQKLDRPWDNYSKTVKGFNIQDLTSLA